MTTFTPNIDDVLPETLRLTGIDLSQQARKLGVGAIRERKHMQPAFRTALTRLLGENVLKSERRLQFDHWQGVPGKRLGGVDIVVRGDAAEGYRALIELKWCPLDGLYMGWAIWDFYKMATGRISPGADSCYLVAGAPSALWAKADSVASLCRTNDWNTTEVFERHRAIWTGDGNDCKKLTALPPRIRTTLVANETPSKPLDEWQIKAIRIEPDRSDETNWLALHEGQLPRVV